MFVCPSCKCSLERIASQNLVLKCKNLNCKLSKTEFESIRSKPILIPYGLKGCIFKKKKMNIFLNLGSKNRSFSSKKVMLKSFFKRLFFGENHQSIKNFKYLINNLTHTSKVLIIGGGTIGSGMQDFDSKCRSDNLRYESIDVYYSENITAIADAHYLPYLNDSFDIVIIQAVLEHVISPKMVVKEIQRVLVDGGIVYSETPFMQSVHEGPYDFTRYSHSGHRWLFKNFEEISSGAINGAFSSTLFIFSYALRGLFRNNKIAIIIRILFTRISIFLDSLVESKSNIDVACGCFFIGRNSKTNKKTVTSDWISDYYRGSQS